MMAYLLKFRNTWLNRLIYKYWFKKHLNKEAYGIIMEVRTEGVMKVHLKHRGGNEVEIPVKI